MRKHVFFPGTAGSRDVTAGRGPPDAVRETWPPSAASGLFHSRRHSLRAFRLTVCWELEPTQREMKHGRKCRVTGITFIFPKVMVFNLVTLRIQGTAWPTGDKVRMFRRQGISCSCTAAQTLRPGACQPRPGAEGERVPGRDHRRREPGRHRRSCSSVKRGRRASAELFLGWRHSRWARTGKWNSARLRSLPANLWV